VAALVARISLVLIVQLTGCKVQEEMMKRLINISKDENITHASKKKY
jgi:hypothetical protein